MPNGQLYPGTLGQLVRGMWQGLSTEGGCGDQDYGAEGKLRWAAAKM